MQNTEISLPSQAFSPDGPPPAEGETVEIQSLKGVVTRTEGEQTYFRPTEINGRPIGSAEGDNIGDDQKADEMPTEEQLRTRAAEEDEEY